MSHFDQHAVRRLRQQLGLSQRQLAIEVGVPPMTIHRWEKGTSRPNSSSARRIKALFDARGLDPFTDEVESGRLLDQPDPTLSRIQRYIKALYVLNEAKSKDTSELVHLVQEYSAMLADGVKAKRPLARRAAALILAEAREKMQVLAEASPTADSQKIPWLQESLMHGTSESFHAVSERDSSFWIDTKLENIRQPYLESNVWAAKKGKAITRIFILSANQDLKPERNIEKLTSVLASHQAQDIPWALVLEEDLGAKASEGEPRDFALFDWTEAVSYFTNREGPRRRLEVAFTSDTTRSTRRGDGHLKRQLAVYRDVIQGCSLVSEQFADRLQESLGDCDTESSDKRSIALLLGEIQSGVAHVAANAKTLPRASQNSDAEIREALLQCIK